VFQESDVIGDAVERAVRLLRGYERGDVVPWHAVERAAGFDRESGHWTQFIKRVRRDLLENPGVKLRAVNGVGLKLLTHEEQVLDLSRQRRACRQLTRGITELISLPDAELSDHQRQAKARKLDSARQGRRKVLAAIRVGHDVARPSATGIPHVRV